MSRTAAALLPAKLLRRGLFGTDFNEGPESVPILQLVAGGDRYDVHALILSLWAERVSFGRVGERDPYNPVYHAIPILPLHHDLARLHPILF